MLVQPQPDLIDVRADERLDEPRLADWLRGKLPGADGELRVRQFAGGKANLTYELRFPRRRGVCAAASATGSGRTVGA